ncbi:hypothetical protein Tco_0797616 [Tanacetum coccineum]
MTLPDISPGRSQPLKHTSTPGIAAVVMGDKRGELKDSIGNQKLDVLSGSMDQRGSYVRIFHKKDKNKGKTNQTEHEIGNSMEKRVQRFWDEKQIKPWSLPELILQLSNDSQTIVEILKQHEEKHIEREQAANLVVQKEQEEQAA